MNKISDQEILEQYSFSKDGIVINKSTGVVVKQYKNSNGYMEVTVGHYLVRRNVRVHRFVLLEHIPNINNYKEVNHLNGIKDDNRLVNLEWCSREMNNAHAIKNGLVGIYNLTRGNLKCKLTSEQVSSIRGRVSSGESFKSVYKDFNTIIGWWGFRDICRGTAWKHVV